MNTDLVAILVFVVESDNPRILLLQKNTGKLIATEHQSSNSIEKTTFTRLILPVAAVQKTLPSVDFPEYRCGYYVARLSKKLGGT